MRLEAAGEDGDKQMKIDELSGHRWAKSLTVVVLKDQYQQIINDIMFFNQSYV